MTNLRGRSFLLKTKPLGRDLEIEVTARKDLRPAYAWILRRWKDVNNFYEVVLKKAQVEVWRKDRGEYYDILPRRQIERLDASIAHQLKVKIVGDVPEITVSADDDLVWSGEDRTGLGPSEGTLVALETEFSTVTVEKASVTQLE